MSQTTPGPAPPAPRLRRRLLIDDPRLSGTKFLVRHNRPGRTITLLFLALILAGSFLLSLPLALNEQEPDWLVAAFTATSAACVTGLTVVDTSTHWSTAGQIIILCLIQLGGLGYMAFSTLLASLFGRQPGLHGKRLLQQSLGEVTMAEATRLLVAALRFTLVVELIGAAILGVRFASEPGRTPLEGAWLGLFHSVSAFCNAGFDLLGTSLIEYRGDWIVNLVVSVLIIIGGLGFVPCEELYRRLRSPSPRPLSLHTQIVVTVSIALTLLGAVSFAFTEWSNPRALRGEDPATRLLIAFFQSVTCRTAGFNSVDLSELRSVTLMVMGILMVVGASPGGTGGGIKTTTLATTLLAVRSSILGRSEIEVFRRRIDPEMVYRSLVLVTLALTAIIGGTIILVFTEPDNLLRQGIRDRLFVRLQFEVMSAFGTVGLGTGITAALSVPGKLTLMVLMFIGRLGPITVATAWTLKSRAPRRRYPEERVALG